MIRKTLLWLMALGILISPSARAEMSRQDIKKANAASKGTWYLRMDAPCTKGRHPYGVFYSPLVEVSPSGINAEEDTGASFGWYHASSTILAMQINDPVKVGDLDWDEEEGTVELELEGTGPADGKESVISLVGIQSPADFEAAFAKAFSPRPLQDDHPDWPAEIRDAIGKRKLVNGMTKRQAHYVVGTPSRIEKSQDGGREIETWTLPQQGIEVGFWMVKGGDSRPPQTVIFEDGKLVSSSTSTSGSKLDLDD